MGSDCSDTPTIYNDYLVRIFNGSCSLSDDDLGRLRNELAHSLADQRIGLRIYRTC